MRGARECVALLHLTCNYAIQAQGAFKDVDFSLELLLDLIPVVYGDDIPKGKEAAAKAVTHFTTVLDSLALAVAEAKTMVKGIISTADNLLVAATDAKEKADNMKKWKYAALISSAFAMVATYGIDYLHHSNGIPELVEKAQDAVATGNFLASIRTALTAICLAAPAVLSVLERHHKQTMQTLNSFHELLAKSADVVNSIKEDLSRARNDANLAYRMFRLDGNRSYQPRITGSLQSCRVCMQRATDNTAQLQTIAASSRQSFLALQ